MVTNAKGIICSFLSFVILCGSTSDVSAMKRKLDKLGRSVKRVITEPFKRTDSVSKIAERFEEDAKDNVKDFYDEQHEEEIENIKKANEIAISLALDNLDANAKKDCLWILDYSDKELRLDSIINLCCEFKLIEKKLSLFNSIQDGIAPNTLTSLKEELSQELKDAYFSGFGNNQSLFRRFTSAYTRITDECDSIKDFDERVETKKMLSSVIKLNKYLKNFLKNMGDRYKKANELALVSFVRERSNEEIGSFNMHEGFDNSDRVDRSLPNEELKKIANEYITTIESTSISKIVM